MRVVLIHILQGGSHFMLLEGTKQILGVLSAKKALRLIIMHACILP